MTRAIPVHLLTQEAFELYEQRINKNGVLAVHVSNRYLDLVPVVAAAVKQMGWQAISVSNNQDEDTAVEAATWILLTKDPLLFSDTAFTDPMDDEWNPSGKIVEWTDQFSNLLSVYAE